MRKGRLDGPFLHSGYSNIKRMLNKYIIINSVAEPNKINIGNLKMGGSRERNYV